MEIRIERREEYSSRRLAAEMLAAAAKTDPENIRFYRGKNGKPGPGKGLAGEPAPGGMGSGISTPLDHEGELDKVQKRCSLGI